MIKKKLTLNITQLKEKIERLNEIRNKADINLLNLYYDYIPNQQLAQAYFKLGSIYENETKKANDLSKENYNKLAFECYEKASDIGYFQATIKLSEIYEKGLLGNRQNKKEASYLHNVAWECETCW
tara:strand:- start:201 stop:578 length:378 start_codon:yes stop_codon:yes gene_type:complete